MEHNNIPPLDVAGIKAPTAMLTASEEPGPQQEVLHVGQDDRPADDNDKTGQEAAVSRTSFSEVDRERKANPNTGEQENVLSAESEKFEAQLLETKALLTTVEQFAEEIQSQSRAAGLQARVPKQPTENEFMAMPPVLADVEKIHKAVEWASKYHNPTGHVGHYTDLAINSLTRHLERLNKEKDQLGAMESEVRRLRAIETHYNELRSGQVQVAANAALARKARETIVPGKPDTEADPATSADAKSTRGAEGSMLNAATTPITAVDEGSVHESEELGMTFVPELNRVEWPGFRECIELNEIRKAYAIDVLIGEPLVSFEEEQQFWWLPRRNTGAGRETKPRAAPTAQMQSMLPGQAALPERIRINSLEIKLFLEDVFEGSPGWDSTDPGWGVMIRPYKALVCYEKEIHSLFLQIYGDKKSNKDIESTDAAHLHGRSVEQDHRPAKNGQMSPTMAKDSRDDHGSIAPQPATSQVDQISVNDASSSNGRTETDRKEMECLMEFMTELREKISWVESPQCQSITFDDLWFLFKPGDEVVEQSRNQVYRILEVTGATHQVTPPWRDFERVDLSDGTSEKASIRLRCAYICFDGAELGPTSVHFTIGKWDGTKVVTSLEVFPLRCMAVHLPSQERTNVDLAPSAQATRNRFIERGRRYLDVTTNVFKHMHYSGLTLDKGDEVDSHVVVDFNEAFVSSTLMRRPKLENLISLGQSLGVADNKKKLCEADCCACEDICEEEFAELKRSREHFAGLIPEDTRRAPSMAIYPRESGLLKYAIGTVSDSDLVIMAYSAPGFILRNRTWGLLNLMQLSLPNESEVIQFGPKVKPTEQDTERLVMSSSSNPPTPTVQAGTAESERAETAFDQLVLPPGHKRMLLSLVAQHFRDKDATSQQGDGEDDQTDIVRGKGKGLIVLLHGAPGVGKTSTAEGVAELFERPLFQITCGDLGATAEAVDLALGKNFSLANKWGCVLLLDEADVFLASRTKEDFVRNGLVSVFLRVLEYYAGILFLTTNRIGDFDEAFTSRIHISLYYPQLQLGPAQEIFKLNFGLIRKRFAKKSRRILIQEEQILQTVSAYWKDHDKERWNGRQIRNACQTALALAEFDAQGGSYKEVLDKNATVQLTVEHLMTVSTAYLGFMEYLSKVRDKDDERWAKIMRIRAMERDVLDPGKAQSTTISGSVMKTPQSKHNISPTTNSHTPTSPAPAVQPQAGVHTAQAYPGSAQAFGTDNAAPPPPGHYPAYQYMYPWPGYGQMPSGAPAYPTMPMPGAPNAQHGTPQGWAAPPGIQQGPPQGWAAPPQVPSPWPASGTGPGHQPSAGSASQP